MGMAGDIGTWLAAEGLVGGSTGWRFSEQYRNEAQHRLVVAAQFAGFAPDHRTSLERPGLQVSVRAGEFETDVAEAKVNEIFRALIDQTNWPATIGGTSYRAIKAQQSPFLLEFDGNRRPVWVVNFNVWMSPA